MLLHKSIQAVTRNEVHSNNAIVIFMFYRIRFLTGENDWATQWERTPSQEL